MKLTIYTADTCGQESNVYYPNRLDVADEATFKDAVSFDHVAARYQNNYRSNANFIESDHISMDCDNGKSDDPETWILPEDILSLFEDVSLAIATSKQIARLEAKKTSDFEKYKLGKITKLKFIESKKSIDKELENLSERIAELSKQDEVVKDNELTRELMEKYIDSVLCEGSIVQKIIWK